jgi:hypothetical protein
MKTTTHDFEYLGLKYTGHKAYSSRMTLDAALQEATTWMKARSKTFIGFELMTTEFETGNYVARHSNEYAGSKTHLNGNCVIRQSDSGKRWITHLSVRVHRR